MLRSKIGSHEVIVSIEARASARKADSTWVEMMLGKHEDLPTSKLVLVSENGFTDPARRHAAAKGQIAHLARGPGDDHPGRRVLDGLRALQAEEVTFELTDMVMNARRPNVEKVRVRVPLNMNVYDAEGRYLTMLNLLFEAERAANVAEFHRDVSSPGGALRATFIRAGNLPSGEVADEDLRSMGAGSSPRSRSSSRKSWC